MEKDTITIMADDDLVLALCESETDANRAIQQIHAQYGGKLLGVLRKKDWLTKEDRQDVIQDIYLRLWQKGQKGNLNVDSKIQALLMKMAHDAAVDVLRKMKREKALLTSDEYMSLCQDGARGSDIGMVFARLERAREADVLLDDFREWMDSLPRKQQEVAIVWADCCQEDMDRTRGYPKRIGPTIIYDEMLKRDMDPGSVMAVKSAMQQFRAKFRDRIQRSGDTPKARKI